MAAVIGEPLLVVLSSAGGFSVSVGVLVAVVTLAGVLPLRGGGGQHAHAGPGTLTVWQLCRSEEPAARQRYGILAPLAGTSEVAPEPGGNTWPHPVWPEGVAEAPRVLDPGQLREASVSRSEPSDPGYVGRHRLIHPFERFRADLVFHAC